MNKLITHFEDRSNTVNEINTTSKNPPFFVYSHNCIWLCKQPKKVVMLLQYLASSVEKYHYHLGCHCQYQRLFDSHIRSSRLAYISSIGLWRT